MRRLTDPIVANLYRRTSDGRTLFCPWGNLGRAYIVPPEREEELTRFVRRLYLVMLGTIVIVTPFLHWWALVLAPVFSGIWFFKYWSFSRTLAVDSSAPPPVDRRQLLLNLAGAFGVRRLWFLLISALVFVAVGVWTQSEGRNGEGLFMIIFFGLGAILFAVQLIMLGRRS